MKTQTSAGGIVACPVGEKWHVLILKDMNGSWTFPKGLIEKGEHPQSTAIREIMEEVHIGRLSLCLPLTPIRYFYKKNGIIKKTVYYFLFTTKTRMRPKVQKEEGISEAKWVPIADAMRVIGYRRTNVPLLEETWKLVKRQTFKN